MTHHPYKDAPAEAFWSRVVSNGVNPEGMFQLDAPLIRSGELVASAGSCFAANLVPYLEKNGIKYIKSEYKEEIWSSIAPENYSYSKFSAAYGNIYTARQMLQLLLRCQGKFLPIEDRVNFNGNVVDMFRPGLRYAARSNIEFDHLTNRHLKSTFEVLSACDVFIFTLGLTEAWVSKLDGAVFPACPGTIAGEFDSQKHLFKNFNVSEVCDDLCELIHEFNIINPKSRIIFTVSPVPLVATASGAHVVPATMYSKSVLRVAAEEVSRSFKQVSYFPSYDIIVGPQAPDFYFESDLRNVSQKGIDAVMRVFLNACEIQEKSATSGHDKSSMQKINSADKNDVTSYNDSSSLISKISKAIVEKDCEEAMSDVTTNTY